MIEAKNFTSLQLVWVIQLDTSVPCRRHSNLKVMINNGTIYPYRHYNRSIFEYTVEANDPCGHNLDNMTVTLNVNISEAFLNTVKFVRCRIRFQYNQGSFNWTSSNKTVFSVDTPMPPRSNTQSTIVSPVMNETSSSADSVLLFTNATNESDDFNSISKSFSHTSRLYLLLFCVIQFLICTL